MCGGLHYGEVEGLVSVESGLVAEMLYVWWYTFHCCETGGLLQAVLR